MRLPCTILATACAILGLTIAELSAQTREGRQGERSRIRQGTLSEGDVAPDFTLRDVAGTNQVRLADLRGKPVVLIFGSCTCPPFVSSTRSTERLYTAYKDRVHFYTIYIREAHPSDGRAISNNRFQVRSPTSLDERAQVAGKFAEELNLSVPVLVDAIDDPIEKAYSCWPNRLYIIDAEGKIADKGMAGPRGVRSSMKRASQVLDELLADAE